MGQITYWGLTLDISTDTRYVEFQGYMESVTVNTKTYRRVYVEWRRSYGQWRIQLDYRDPFERLTNSAHNKLYAEAERCIPDIEALRTQTMMPHLFEALSADMADIEAQAQRLSWWVYIGKAVEHLYGMLEESPLEIVERLFPGKLTKDEDGVSIGIDPVLYLDSLDCLEVIAVWCTHYGVAFPSELTAARAFATTQREKVEAHIKVDNWSVARLQYLAGRMRRIN